MDGQGKGKGAHDLEKWLAAKHVEIEHDEDDDAALADLLEITTEGKGRGRMPTVMGKMKGPPAIYKLDGGE